MTKGNTFDRDKFSPSAQSALEFAYSRAHPSSPSGKPGVDPTERQISALDLLAGISVAHGSESPVRRLMEYYGVPFAALERVLKLSEWRGGTKFPEDDDYDNEASSILGMSEKLASSSASFYSKSPGKSQIQPRHLFGGILALSNSARDLLEKQFAAANAPFDEAQALYQKYLESDFDDSSFTKFLAKNPRARARAAQVKPTPTPTNTAPNIPSPAPPAATIAQQPSQPPTSSPDTTTQSNASVETLHPAALSLFTGSTISGFTSDTINRQGPEDLIGIGAEVDAFAYLISAKTLQPPLAIGLFGDWGSGKSFFMQALQKRIEKITGVAVSSGETQKEISVFKRVLQINFNAWHYVEGQLWASLVEHIFQNLAIHPGHRLTLLEKRRGEIIQQIDQAKDKEKSIRAAKENLEAAKAEQIGKLARLKTERDEKIAKLDQFHPEIVLHQPLSPQDKKILDDKFRELGITASMSSIAEFAAALQELRATLQRGNTLTTLMRTRGWGWTLTLMGVLIVTPIIGLGVSYLIGAFAQVQLPALTSALIAFSVFLSGLTAMLKLGTGKLSAMIAQVEAAQKLVDEKRQKVEHEYEEQRAAAQKELDDIQSQYEVALHEQEAIEAQLELFQKNLALVTPQYVFLEFIRERYGSQDYSKLLGLAALIRRDFEQLADLIDAQNQQFIESDDGKEAPPESVVNRIVLYIDDLDRCPPDRVVQVLQAVHLLLAFPLFVVIVAVDARWLSQSLEKHYEDLLSNPLSDGSRAGQGDPTSATPQDYLEKIFQIPYWVRPLDSQARLKIVEGLLKNSPAPSTREEPKTDATTPETLPAAAQTDDSKAGAAQTVPVHAPAAEANAAAPHEDKPDKRPVFDAQSETSLNPPALAILPHELACINGLESLLGKTPRAVKRFVNLYRLLKAIALTQNHEFTANVRYADYQKVLFLLAMMTGSPSVANELFRRLRYGDENTAEGKPMTLGSFLLELKSNLDKEAHAGKTNGAGVATSLPPPDENASRNFSAEYWQRKSEISSVTKWVETYDAGSWQALELSQLKNWVPEVERFSFQVRLM